MRFLTNWVMKVGKPCENDYNQIKSIIVRLDLSVILCGVCLKYS